jgi:hypothetical protein
LGRDKHEDDCEDDYPAVPNACCCGGGDDYCVHEGGKWDEEYSCRSTGYVTNLDKGNSAGVGEKVILDSDTECGTYCAGL